MVKNLSTVFTAIVIAIFANFIFFKGLALPIEKQLEAKAKGLPDEKSISEFIGKEQINFHGIDESGNKVDIRSITEGKPAVIIFFAIGDKPGTFDFLPHMNELYDKYKDKVEFVGVLLSRSNAKEVQELKKMLPLKMPVLLGYSDAIKGYEISKLDVPFIVMVDEDGKIERIIVRPESDMIEEAPAVDRTNYQNMNLKERINESIKNIDNYIQEMIK